MVRFSKATAQNSSSKSHQKEIVPNYAQAKQIPFQQYHHNLKITLSQVAMNLQEQYEKRKVADWSTSRSNYLRDHSVQIKQKYKLRDYSALEKKESEKIREDFAKMSLKRDQMLKKLVRPMSANVTKRGGKKKKIRGGLVSTDDSARGGEGEVDTIVRPATSGGGRQKLPKLEPEEDKDDGNEEDSTVMSLASDHQKSPNSRGSSPRRTRFPSSDSRDDSPKKSTATSGGLHGRARQSTMALRRLSFHVEDLNILEGLNTQMENDRDTRMTKIDFIKRTTEVRARARVRVRARARASSTQAHKHTSTQAHKPAPQFTH